MSIDRDAVIARLAATDSADERAAYLRALLHEATPDAQTLWALAERIKDEADRIRSRDVTLSLRWSDDVVALGNLAGEPTIVALGRMIEAFTLYEQGRYRESLERYDEASDMFSRHGHDVGWARTQIGRTVACMALSRFDEALERGARARAILEREGDHLRVAGVDNNLALLLERMNRPSEALAYSEHALATYRAVGQTYYAIHTLSNHALLLWRLGRVREALEAHEEARAGYVASNALMDAAIEDLNIGVVHLALGHFADAVNMLTIARQNSLAAQSPYWAAVTALYLAECYVCMGRYRDAAETASVLVEEFARYEDVVRRVQALLWQAMALAGLREYKVALQVLDAVASVLDDHDGLTSYRSTLDLARAQLLLEMGRRAEAEALLQVTIPELHTKGLTVDAAAALILWGNVILDDGRCVEATAAAGRALTVARGEGLDWLAARSLHLRGRVEMRQGDDGAAHHAFAQAVRHLDRVSSYVAWDDRVSFAGTAVDVYEDAMALALRRAQPLVALGYAERAKARALADHLRVGIDVRPRARDERSRVLVDELAALRERYAWLNAAKHDESAAMETPLSAVRWAAPVTQDAATRAEAARVERRMAEIWRELQAANPAYRGEAAALNVAGLDEEPAADEDAADRWIAGMWTTLDQSGAALLEYVALGDDLVLFVLREGTAQAVRLGAVSDELRRLVALLRLNVERAARASSSRHTSLALAANVRGILGRLHNMLLAPAVPLLDGAARLVIVPQGVSYHVPFHALHDGARYLIERCEVSYAPCASLVEHFEERHRFLSDSGRLDGRGALALACSDRGALPHVGAEGQAVVAALGGCLLCEDKATIAALWEQAGDCAALHLAAHGVFRPDEPLFSALRLGDGQLSTLDVFDLELNCSLVTLSACETALGTRGAGDELMGLSRAFLYAGAPSLVLSLWKVEDRSTAALMEVFYSALGRGESKAAALRAAQLALLHNAAGDGSDYSAPFFWAPFVLIGHAGPLVKRAAKTAAPMEAMASF